MHIRSHLDYCDIIFHTPVITHEDDSSLTLNYIMDALERIQYQAALAVSGAWRGTNTDKIYEELGWETLDMRRNFHRLTMFYKIMNNLTPVYLRDPIPPKSRHGLRSPDVLNVIPFRTDRYHHSFYPDSVKSWNGIGPALRGAKSLSKFKESILKLIRPAKKDIFNIHNRNGIGWIFQLRVGLSPLKSHKMSHNFEDTPVDTCLCTQNAETTHHFLLECPIFTVQRQEFLETIFYLFIYSRDDYKQLTYNK